MWLLPVRPQQRILIADDHALYRNGLRLLLSDSFPKTDVRDVDGFDMALEGLSNAAPIDLAVLDLKMPGMEGVESLRAVREACPETAILVPPGLRRAQRRLGRARRRRARFFAEGPPHGVPPSLAGRGIAIFSKRQRLARG